ncbi:serine hydrolase domain-containing protein [Streptomyces sp. TP-A0874]|uniref:serine hydrolase domain-containing protein n=1 Tax=Streptomyces sp. TP-A0874 TaxID=549819 RepID=UPI000852A72B|nr:serine hydrolase domain-containing protein [Streptomyces sp. TP-A0874]
MTASFTEPAAHEELLPGTARALYHRTAVAQAQGRTPSLVAAVVRGDEVVWSAARGESPAAGPAVDLQYRVGSITKTFTAVLVLRLRDDGLLGLDDPLERHLPGTGVGGVTIAQLLSHSAGLAAESPAPWWERTPGELRPTLREVLGEQPRLHPAGRLHHYSNPGYTLLGSLVEQVRGRPWAEVLRAEVLDPLGLTRTTTDPEEPHATGWAVHPWADVLLPEPTEDLGLMAPAGQLWSTAADLARFAVFLKAGDDRVLSAESVAELRVPAVPPGEGAWGSGYGLGLQLLEHGGRRLVGHSGSLPGFLAAMWLSTEDDLAAVALANTTSGVAVGTLAADLLKIVADREPRIPDPWRPLTEVEPALLELTGTWYWGPTPYTLRLRTDRGLELRPSGGAGRASRFRAESDGTWTGLDGYYLGETLRPVPGTDGAAVGHLDLGSFVFTRQPYDPSVPVPGGVDPGGWRPTD